MIEKISVFAADIDGTLAEKGGVLMPKTRAAIHSESVILTLVFISTPTFHLLSSFIYLFTGTI